MVRPKNIISGHIIFMILVTSLTPRLAQAQDTSRLGNRSMQFNIGAPVGPIGSAQTLDGLMINGRKAYGERLIWSGDLLQAPINTNVRVSIDSVGEITLIGGAIVRVATKSPNGEDSTDRRVLVASLESGDMDVELRQHAEAYIEGSGYVITSSSGASFSVMDREDRALIEIVNGSVNIQAAHKPGTYKASDVRVLGDGRMVEMANPGPLKKKTGQKADISTLWKFYFHNRPKSILSSRPHVMRVSYQPSQNEEFAAKRLVHFEVNPPDLGTLERQDVTTDDRGLAQVRFTAGRTRRTGKIRGYVVKDPNLDHPETEYEVYERVVIVEPLGFWRLRNILIVAAVGGATIGCVVKCKKNEPGTPRPVIIP